MKRHLVFLTGGIHVSRIILLTLLGVVRLGGAALLIVIVLLYLFPSAHTSAAVYAGLVAVAGHRARGGVGDPSANTCLLPFQQFSEIDNRERVETKLKQYGVEVFSRKIPLPSSQNFHFKYSYVYS